MFTDQDGWNWESQGSYEDWLETLKQTLLEWKAKVENKLE